MLKGGQNSIFWRNRNRVLTNKKTFLFTQHQTGFLFPRYPQSKSTSPKNSPETKSKRYWHFEYQWRHEKCSSISAALRFTDFLWTKMEKMKLSQITVWCHWVWRFEFCFGLLAFLNFEKARKCSLWPRLSQERNDHLKWGKDKCVFLAKNSYFAASKNLILSPFNLQNIKENHQKLVTKISFKAYHYSTPID